MRGVYGGIDTCNVTQFGNFNFCSYLTEKNESLSITRRPDIRGLVNMLVAEKVLNTNLAKGLLSTADRLFGNFDFSKHMKGATYMTMEDSVALQKNLCSDEFVTLTESSTSEVEGAKSFVLLWPKSLVWVHPAGCCYGARFNDLPLLRSLEGSTQLAWFLLGMLTMIPEVWSCTVRTLTSTTQWNGWFLRIASIECLGLNKRIPRGQGRQHPFAQRKLKAV